MQRAVADSPDKLAQYIVHTGTSKGSYFMPYFKEDHEPESAVQDAISWKLIKSRTVLVSGQVDQELAERVITKLLVLDADSNDPIRVIITSQGGHVDSGFAIHDMMQFVKSEVITIGAGWVASIAVPIMMAAKKQNRLSLPNTRFLLHQPSGGGSGHLADLRIEAQEILKIRQRLNELLAHETGQTVDKIKTDSDRNFWMSAEEAVDYGLVSRIIANVSEI